jgi:cyanophycin synthetase
MKEPIFQFVIDRSVRVLTFFGLANWQTDFNQENIDSRARAMIEEGEKLGISFQRLKLFQKESELFQATKDGRQIVFKHLPLGRSYRRTQQDRVDDKWYIKQLLIKNKLPIVAGQLVLTVGQALRVARELGYPVIVKPRLGSLSKGVYLNNFNSQKLKESFQKSRRWGYQLLIEPQVTGDDYRVTLVGGKMKAVAKRESASVIGDGQSSIKKLIEEKNRHPLRSTARSTTLHQISSKDLPKNYLSAKGIKLSDIPKKKEKIYLNFKVNLASGADIIDVTGQVHPDNRRLFEQVAKLFDAEILGIDFKSPDITIPYQKNQGKILELNSLPYLNMHHYPWQGKKIPVARYLWRRIFN